MAVCIFSVRQNKGLFAGTKGRGKGNLRFQDAGETLKYL